MKHSPAMTEAELSAREHWRELARAPRAGGELKLGLLWDAMVFGSVVLVDTFLSNEHCVIVFKRRERPMLVPSAECLSFLKRALTSSSIKEAAIDCGVSPSTASMQMSRALQFMGCTESGSKTPLAIVLLAHASVRASYELAPVTLASCVPDPLDDLVLLVRVRRPEYVLASRLTPQELTTVRMLVEGLSHEAISLERRRSKRTIANQLASVFRRLGVSGRFDLLRYVCREAIPSAFERTSGVQPAARAVVGVDASGVI
ncbi:MAG: helix-turn-helix transcriptional regulator [Polyangiaceae bacterium]